jgi:hypothetical protein
MIVAIWYHISEKLPVEEGWYFGVNYNSLSDEDETLAQFYFNGKQFFENPHCNVWVNVTSWSDIGINRLVNKPAKTSTIAETIAFDKMIAAINNYNMIKALS